MATALLFPGQGLHFVGMGQSLAQQFATARRVFDEVDDALAAPLSRLAWEGPEADLTLTANAQPAILAHAIAAFRVLQERIDLAPTVAVGHSLGEWSALVAAGVLDLPTAARLVRQRGQFMQDAVPAGVGAMAAVLGLERAAIEQACLTAAQGEVVAIATCNDLVNTVISGHAGAVERAGALCMQAGALKVAPLTVSAPFHSPLMAPAALRLDALLAPVVWRAPQFAIQSTVNAQRVTDAAAFRQLLVLQMTAPVLWQDAIAAIAAQGITAAFALGPAAALPGMVKRTARGIKVTVVSEAADVPA